MITFRARHLLFPVIQIISLAFAGQVVAKEAASLAIEIRYAERQFTPKRVETVPGRPVTLRVVNASKERIEFESVKLNREKVVEGGETLVLHLPALRPGRYDFFDDFHSDVPEGEIIAR